MQEAFIPVSMQQCHAYFQFGYDGCWSWISLCSWLGVEDCFSAFAPSGG
jgi:hypothetical protein